MAGYEGFFARYYDALTADVDYQGHGTLLKMLTERHGGRFRLVLDLACGTGSLSVVLSRLGAEVIGVDGSREMLAQAAVKSQNEPQKILYLCQEMEELDLYGTVDAAFCAMDSLNHLPGREALRRVFRRVRLFVEPGGLFIFDMNTPFKHKFILANNTFVRETEELYCVWQNTFSVKNSCVKIDLDIFARERDGRYVREQETFREYAYPTGAVCAILEEEGFQLLELRGDYVDAPPGPEEQRVLYIARRK